MPTPEIPFIKLARRGISIAAPQETARNMMLVKQGEGVIWSREERTRLRTILEDPILKKRYPQPQDGKNFMQHVDYERREKLLLLACGLTNCIVSSWKKINPDKDIAVVLFGSVAKNLVKSANHPSPSNIDLVVIGDFSEEERNNLFDAIRPDREKTSTTILNDCANVLEELRSIDGGNAGVHIQNIKKLTKNKFSDARRYIGSRAQALYDPAGIWLKIENAALENYAVIWEEKKQRAENHKPGTRTAVEIQ